MTPRHRSFVPNPDFGKQLKRELDVKAQHVVDDVTARFRADSSLNLKGELNDGLSQQGIDLPDENLDERAGIVASGEDLTVDIRIV